MCLTGACKWQGLIDAQRPKVPLAEGRTDRLVHGHHVVLNPTPFTLYPEPQTLGVTLIGGAQPPNVHPGNVRELSIYVDRRETLIDRSEVIIG